MATKLVFGNFKGGVGKTTTSSIIAFLLQEQKRKTLYIDFDAQANATQLMYKTFDLPLEGDYVSVFEAMQGKDLSKGILKASPYLDFIPSGEDLVAFPKLLTKNTRQTFLKDLISDIEDDYEFIIFDVPPTISEFNDNVFVASDYVIPVLQTAIFSAQGIPSYLDYANGIRDNHNESLKVLGIIAYLVNKRDRIDKIVLDGSDDYIKELIFKSIIHNRARVKAYPEDGIQRNDFHDKRTLKMYEDLLKEILTKINQEEGN